MKVKFSDIDMAYEFVSSSPYGEHSAMLDKSTGQMYWTSEMGDSDEIPDEVCESDNTVEIPHKDDLDLGRDLVFDFASSHLPDDYQRIRQIFSREGAYRRYKDLLESKGLLEKWYKFEEDAQNKALREWAEDNGIELIE